METNNGHTQEDQIDIIEILFTILSQRFLIISSLIIFIFLGIIYNYYHQDIFKTNATLLISEDQSDPSSCRTTIQIEKKISWKKVETGEASAP